MDYIADYLYGQDNTWVYGQLTLLMDYAAGQITWIFLDYNNIWLDSACLPAAANNADCTKQHLLLPDCPSYTNLPGWVGAGC